LEKPTPIQVVNLFPEILDRLLELLSNLEPREWERPTACEYWTVKDVAQHLLGGDVGILSRRRDGYALNDKAADWHELVALVDASNELWVSAARRMSPALLCDLLRFTGDQVCSYFRTWDLDQIGGAVSWAGPEPAPVWLDLAREYTERWLHQQHIRQAVDRPGMLEPKYLAPVLATFVHAMPRAYSQVEAPQGTHITLTITGESGGRWALERREERWELYQGSSPQAAAQVVIPQDLAWRLFTRGLSREQAVAGVSISGDRALGLKLLEAVAIIA
jgi:uncharacterized protein (TIGR03083 family)